MCVLTVVLIAFYRYRIRLVPRKKAISYPHRQNSLTFLEMFLFPNCQLALKQQCQIWPICLFIENIFWHVACCSLVVSFFAACVRFETRFGNRFQFFIQSDWERSPKVLFVAGDHCLNWRLTCITSFPIAGEN